MTTKSQVLMRIETLWDDAQHHLASSGSSPMRRIDQLMDAALLAEAQGHHQHSPRVEGDLAGIAAMVKAASMDAEPSLASKPSKNKKVLSFDRAKEKMDQVAKLKAPVPHHASTTDSDQIRHTTKRYLNHEGEALIAATIKTELKAFFAETKKAK